jgi:2-iminoacetate synthase ThiH
MRRLRDIARLLVPAVCDISVTNVCNATCDFCSFARGKDAVRKRFWIDRDRLKPQPAATPPTAAKPLKNQE